MQNTVNVTYVGGPTVILEIGGLRLMTDPTLDPAGTMFRINEKPAYQKLEDPAATAIGDIDIVLLSHDQHGDNLDNAGRELIKTVPKIITTKIGAERLKGNAIGLAPWESIVVNTPDQQEVTITGTPARHGPAGVEKLTGEVTGFLVSVKGSGNLGIYITGDTVFYEGVKQVAERFDPQYVFIFAGAARPRGPFNVTMGTNDAIDTAHVFPKATLIPIHSEGWTHYTENNEDVKKAFTILGIEKQLKLLEPGVLTALHV